jgi:hypothetical protein
MFLEYSRHLGASGCVNLDDGGKACTCTKKYCNSANVPPVILANSGNNNKTLFVLIFVSILCNFDNKNW